MKKLERELGMALFERGTHKIPATQVAERVVEKAQQALDAVEAVKQVAESDQPGDSI